MSSMGMSDEFLRRAVECERQAKQMRDAAERRSWLQIAERWRRCAEAFAVREQHYQASA